MGFFFFWECQDWFNIQKSIDDVYHIHAIKEENHMIIPIVAHKKNAFVKLQHPFMIKTSNQLGRKRHFPQPNQGHL